MKRNSCPRGSMSEIVEEGLRVVSDIAQSGGEITPELEAQLSQVGEKLSQKVDNYFFVICRLDNEEELWRKRIAQYEKFARGCAKYRERLKDNIRSAMLALDKREVSGEEIRFVIQNGPAGLLLNEESLPEQYVIRGETRDPDRERIRADLEQGIEIPGAKLKESLRLMSYPAKAVNRDWQHAFTEREKDKEDS